MLTVLLAIAASIRLLPSRQSDADKSTRLVPFAYGYNGLVDMNNTSAVYNPAARGQVVLMNPGKRHPRFTRVPGL